MSWLTWWARLVHAPSCMPAHQVGDQGAKHPYLTTTPRPSAPRLSISVPASTPDILFCAQQLMSMVGQIPRADLKRTLSPKHRILGNEISQVVSLELLSRRPATSRWDFFGQSTSGSCILGQFVTTKWIIISRGRDRLAVHSHVASSPLDPFHPGTLHLSPPRVYISLHVPRCSQLRSSATTFATASASTHIQ